MYKYILMYVFSVLMLCSCGSSRNVEYVQDLGGDSTVFAMPPQEIRLQPYDRISITVSSRDPELSALFNLQAAGGAAAGSDSIQVKGMSKYTIDRGGNIDFPVIGALHIAGLTRDAVGKLIKQRLADSRLLTDGVVTVEFDNLSLSVLGEVNRPGCFAVTRDCITIFDAVSMAGDITESGDRRDVVVIRREGWRQVAYSVNLCSAQSLYSSPAYYLQQNDVVYVKHK